MAGWALDVVVAPAVDICGAHAAAAVVVNHRHHLLLVSFGAVSYCAGDPWFGQSRFGIALRVTKDLI